MVPKLLKRACSAVVLLAAVATAAFFLTGISGAEPGRTILGPEATPAAVAAENHQLGVDRPLVTQYVDWVGHALQGDLGRSYLNDESVTKDLGQGLPVTMSLVALSLAVAAVMSLVLAVFSALGRRWVDRLVQLLTLVGHVMPSYLLALLLLLVFAVKIRAFPVFGYVQFGASPGGWLNSLVLPVAALALGSVAGASLQARGALLDVLSTDYIRTLRSRGISSRSVLFRHALRNAAPPWLTSLSLGFVAMLGGAFMVEKVFAMPGLGTVAVNATTTGDRPVIMGLVVLTGGMIIVVNLLTDLAQLWLIPKARLA